MPHKVNPEKSDLSVLIWARLRKSLVKACEEDNVSLTRATKEALERWLASRDRKRQRAAKEPKMPDS